MASSDPAVELRPLVIDDAAEAAALIRAAFAVQSVPTDPPSAALRETTETIATAIVEGGGVCIVEGGDMIAAMLWMEKEGGLYFGRLAVRPDRRGQGLARRLVAAAEAEACRLALPRVHLSTRLALLDNRRLFAACGYREVGFRRHHGYSTATSVVMEKHL